MVFGSEEVCRGRRLSTGCEGAGAPEFSGRRSTHKTENSLNIARVSERCQTGRKQATQHLPPFHGLRPGWREPYSPQMARRPFLSEGEGLAVTHGLTPPPRLCYLFLNR